MLDKAEVDEQTLSYYQINSNAVAARYESVSGGASSLFPFVFSKGERVLDIGAGSGRDAALLLDLGADVQAVEPSEALRARAAALHPELAGRLHEGRLPGPLPGEVSGPFDGILLAAVLMHIPENELFDTVLALRDRLREGGSLLLSTAVQRDDVPAGAERDGSGRLMIVRPAAQVRLLFERLGFQLKNEWASGDAAGRPGVLWTTMHFVYSRGTLRAIDRIESILNADRKVATYKLALIRALCDIALTAYARTRWESGGRVSVPVADLAERWVKYYWPLVDSRQFMPQINGESKGARPIAFRAALAELAAYFTRLGGLPGFAKALADRSLPAEAQRLYRKVIRVASTTIVKGPVFYAGGARGIREFHHDPTAGRVLIEADVWRELTLMGHWIRDAVVLRWADMTERLSAGAVNRGAVLDKLTVTTEAARLDQGVRKFYEGRLPDLRCIWTDRRLTAEFDVEHAIPFALWQNSSLWNLFPSSKTVNSRKRDRLPSRDLVRRREEPIIENWRTLVHEFPTRFPWEAAALSRETLVLPEQETEGVLLASGWERALFSRFVEAIEYTAAVRGAERWEP